MDTWGCDGDAEPNVHHHAKRIMAEMGDIDIPASLASIKNAGGYCDCEILLNVDPGFWALGEISVICDFRAVCSRVRIKVSPAARDRGRRIAYRKKYRQKVREVYRRFKDQTRALTN